MRSATQTACPEATTIRGGQRLKTVTALFIVLASIVLVACDSPPPEEGEAQKPLSVSGQETASVEMTRHATAPSLTASPEPMPTARPTIMPAAGTEAPSDVCWRSAVTQLALNECAWMEAEESRALLLQAISRNKTLASDAEFVLLQRQWELQTERECALLLLKQTNGVYDNGSMAPMLYGRCVALRFKSRYEDLRTTACGAKFCDSDDGFPELPPE